MTRNRLFVPVLIGVLATLFTIAILVAWNVQFTNYYMLATRAAGTDPGVGYWLALSVGDVFLVAIVVTLVLFIVTHTRQVMFVRQQTSFIDSVTHELKSPLASLRLCLDTLSLRQVDEERRARFVEMMKLDVDRLQGFIEHVLEASRLEQGQRELAYEHVSLREMIDETIERVCRKHGISTETITVHGLDGLEEARILTDETAFEIILVNLLDNAIKYSPRGPEVDLYVELADDWLRIRVQDKGLGIPKKMLKKIFSRFTRIERPQKSSIQGTGLGLYVVSSLVSRLRGRIEARSPGENEGAEFCLELPQRLHTATS